MVSITSGVSPWCRSCFKKMLDHNNETKCAQMQATFDGCSAHTAFRLDH